MFKLIKIAAASIALTAIATCGATAPAQAASLTVDQMAASLIINSACANVHEIYDRNGDRLAEVLEDYKTREEIIELTLTGFRLGISYPQLTITQCNELIRQVEAG